MALVTNIHGTLRKCECDFVLLRRQSPFPRVLQPPNKQYGYANSYGRTHFITHMFRKTSWHAKMCATFTNAAERLRLMEAWW